MPESIINSIKQSYNVVYDKLNPRPARSASVSQPPNSRFAPGQPDLQKARTQLKEIFNFSNSDRPLPQEWLEDIADNFQEWASASPAEIANVCEKIEAQHAIVTTLKAVKVPDEETSKTPLWRHVWDGAKKLYEMGAPPILICQVIKELVRGAVSAYDWIKKQYENYKIDKAIQKEKYGEALTKSWDDLKQQPAVGLGATPPPMPTTQP